jgi:Zn-dependent alcohol dehydrogenase
MSTHAAVVTTSTRGPLEIIQVPTPEPGVGEVQVRVEWTASTPLDLHQNDSDLLVRRPQVLGDGTAGPVVKMGPGVKNLKVEDMVIVSFASSITSNRRIRSLGLHGAPKLKKHTKNSAPCPSIYLEK